MDFSIPFYSVVAGLVSGHFYQTHNVLNRSDSQCSPKSLIYEHPKDDSILGRSGMLSGCQC